jgi:2-methylcitrate dehydratase
MEKKNEVSQFGPSLDRRDFMKIGAGAVMTTLSGPGAAAQEAAKEAAKGTARNGGSVSWQNVETGPGYKNDAGRISGNGPMDNTSRQLVSYVSSFSESKLTEADLTGLGKQLVDTMAALISGFESEPARIGARIGRTVQSQMKSTILGYGVVTSPDVATFTNCSMARYYDFDGGPAGHASVTIPAILAIGEALHSTGPQVLAAVALMLEITRALSAAETGGLARGLWDLRYEGVSTALACGKLMGLDEDRLANALSIGLVPHLPLNVSHVGALSMFKSCHSPMGAHSGVFAALWAREGLTGPAQPFEERGGLWDSVTGPYKELRLPVSRDGRLVVANPAARYKRYPADGDSQSILVGIIPAIQEWTKVDDIASIQVEVNPGDWFENSDPPKWDPRNSETADHSIPYVMAAALKDGEVYLNHYTPERYVKDASLRQIMDKITIRANPTFYDPALTGPQDHTRVTVRKKSGEQMVKEVFQDKLMTYDDVIAKFKRVCAYKSVSDEQRDRALATWSNLQKVQDIAEPMRDLAHFGKPLPL